MKYLEFTFTTCPSSEEVQDVLSAVLAEVGFDSFVHTGSLDLPRLAQTDDPEAPVFADESSDSQFRAYIRKDLYDAEALKAAVADFPLPDVTVSYECAEAEDRNWNEEWEKNYFQPLTVDGRCVIASTFHKDVPKAEFCITIDPRMSFGTGHHATTSQMISRILQDDMTGLEVLDMGCGTSILAILARMRGAAHCVAIDNDEWCVNNSLENIALNHVDGIDVVLGDASALDGRGPFDLIIANINRNILLADLRRYVPCMKPGAAIYMSGFYVADVPVLREECERLGLEMVDTHDLDGWACVKFQRPRRE